MHVLTDEARAILKGARPGTQFTFDRRVDPRLVHELETDGYIERVPRDTPFWVEGLYRFTRKISIHKIHLIPAPKMDTPTLVAAYCTCGQYRSTSMTESNARKAGIAHVDAKKAA